MISIAVTSHHKEVRFSVKFSLIRARYSTEPATALIGSTADWRVATLPRRRTVKNVENLTMSMKTSDAGRRQASATTSLSSSCQVTSSTRADRAGSASLTTARTG